MVVLVAVIHYNSQNGKKDTISPVTHTAVATVPGGLVVGDKKISNEDKKVGYKITALYPEITSGTSEDAKIKMNHSIVDHIQTVISDFKKGTVDSGAAKSTEESTLDINYQIEPAQSLKHILSIRLIEAIYESGAAHAGNVIETMNLDTSTGEKIGLSAIFSVHPESYLKRLSDFTSAELKKKLGNDAGTLENIQAGTAPTEENFGTYTITNTGIIFIFQEYQVAPYAAGAQEVLVPYTAIQDMVSRDGPLASVRK